MLLRVLPESFRERFGSELMTSYRRDRGRARFHGPGGAARFWWYVLSDVAWTAARLWRRELGSARPASLRDPVISELRHGALSVWRSRRGTWLAVASLALGIGASVAILTVTKRVLLDPLPYPDSDRLGIVWSEFPEAGYGRAPISGPELHDLRTRAEHLDELGSIWTTTGALVEAGEPEAVRVGLVTWNFTSLFGVEMAAGRGFEPADEGTQSDSALISEELWRRRFGGERSVLGRRIRVDGGWGFPGGTFTVVGVMPEGFRLILPPDAGVATELDLWVPFARDLKAGRRGSAYLRTIATLREGSTFADAQRAVGTLGARLESEFPEYDANGRGFDIVPLKRDAIGRARPVILALLAGTGVLLLVTCANVANLLLSRFAERRKEIRVRTALGASSSRVASQLLIESVLVAAVGGAGGLVLGTLAIRPLLALAPAGLPRPDAMVPDPSILALAFTLSLLCGLLIGLAPVVALRDRALFSKLRAASPGGRGRAALVAVELALAFVLTVGASLCFRTVSELERVDLGFDADSVMTVELTLPYQRYGTTELDQLLVELERRLESLPGVVAAGAINQLPLSDLPNWSSPYRLRGSETEAKAGEADGRVVSPGYFRAIDARLMEGRLFSEHDDESSRHVAIVDELLAAKAWPEASPLGQEIELSVATEEGFVPVWAEVVGVVQHMRHHDPRFELREQVFVPFAQGARNQMAVAVRVRGLVQRVTPLVRREVAAIDADIALSNARPLEDYVEDARSVQRFTMVLAALFASMSVLLGCLGVYGVVGHAVSSRRREIGLRVALGSTTSAVAMWVVRQGVSLVVAGIAIGFAGALAAGSTLEVLLYEVESKDPATLLIVPLLLLAVATLASLVPALRATRIDPIDVLRQD